VGVPELDENRSARRKPYKRLGYLTLRQRPQRSVNKYSKVSGARRSRYEIASASPEISE